MDDNIKSESVFTELEQPSEAGAPSETTRKKKGFKSVTDNPTSRLFVFIMLLIPCVYWLVFWLYVNVSSFAMAFQDITGKWDPTFKNFKDFWRDLTSANGDLGVAILNTLKYFATNNLIIFPLTICICYFLYKKIFMHKTMRIIIYLPAIVAPVVLAGLYEQLINGPIDILLQRAGFNVPEDGLLGAVRTATNTIIVYTMWTGLCGNMLIISGTMTRIPVEVLESARLDGVSLFGELIHIIVPLIWPTLSTLLLLSLTGLLNASGPILLLSDNPFQLKTLTMSYWIFEKVWQGGSNFGTFYGLVAATGLCFTAVLIPIVYGVRKLVSYIPTVEY